MSKRIRLALGLAVSALCLYLVLRQVDFARLWALIQEINPLYPIAVNAVLALCFWMRGWRWAILLKPLGRASQGGLYMANLMGFAANNLLPARLGELVRAMACRRFTGVPASGALATIVLERALDGLVLLGVLFAALMSLEPGAQAGAFTVEALRGLGYTLLGIYLAALAVLAAMWRWPGPVMGLLLGITTRLAPSHADKVEAALTGFHQGLAGLGHGWELAKVLALSVLIWAVFLLNFLVFLPAVGLPVSWRLAALAMAGASLGTAVPAGPGYVGTVQLAISWALIMGGAPEQPALAFAVLLWAVHWLPVTAAGLVVMWAKGLSLTGVAHQASAQDLAGNDAGEGSIAKPPSP